MGYHNWFGGLHLLFSCLLILLLWVIVCVDSQGNSDGFINIDCGLASKTTYVESFTGLTYVSDDQYINTGLNGIISSPYSVNKSMYTNLETLRSFPVGTKNCYTLTPVTKGSKYLVRATFYYGNYDRLAKPPGFDLYFGVNAWCSLRNIRSDIWYYCELIAVAPASYIEVCLVNIGLGTPFISVLELRPFSNSLYKQADSTQSLHTVFKRDIGSNDDYVLRYRKDVHDRLWFSLTQPQWTALSTNSPIDGFEFEVPSLVLQTAAVPTTESSINITWSTSDNSTNYLVVLHFCEIQLLRNSSLREFYIYANGEQKFKDPVPLVNYLSPSYAYYHTSGYTEYNMSLKSSARATHPPILNGMELYIIEPVKSPTYDGDVIAINTIKTRYNVSKDWSGDPCVPTAFSWTGINCSIDLSNIPRITDLNLSSNGLTGTMVSAFGQMTALQNLDLSHNNIETTIYQEAYPVLWMIWDLPGNSNLLCTLPSRLQKRLNNGLLTVNFKGTAPLEVQDTKKSSKTIIIVVVAVVILFLIVGAATFLYLMMKYKKTHINPTRSLKESNYMGTRNSTSTFHNQTDNSQSGGVKGLNFDKRQFTFEELRIITNDFSCQVGTGGFGKVFRGRLEIGTEVAVKVRIETSSQGNKEFLNEVEMLSRIHHKNLVSLIGYCKDSNHIALVYEYMQGGNLQDCLRGTDSVTWKQRIQIAYGSAQGLEYLHKMCNPPLIHRDVKASNILLAKNLEAKISDFGSVRAIFGDHVSTRVAGTAGYLDPYYASTSQLTEKSDVYSFGVVLLEIITGKSPILQGGHKLTEFVQQRLSKGNIESILDPNMGGQGQYNLNSIWKVADLALGCTDHPAKRPDMTTIVLELKDSLNLEMSSFETSSVPSGDTSQYSDYSRKANPGGLAVHRGSLEMVHVEGMGLPDYGPSPR